MSEVGLGESGCLTVQPKEGGILHLRLNINERPIAHKYRKGKMQRTLKREFKELEVVEREAIVATCRTTCCEIVPYLQRYRILGVSFPLLQKQEGESGSLMMQVI